MPIVSHLGSKEPSLLGESPVEKALVRQWVTFQVGENNRIQKKYYKGKTRRMYIVRTRLKFRIVIC